MIVKSETTETKPIRMINTKNELLKQWRKQYEEQFGKITLSELLEGVDTNYEPEIQIRLSDSEILEQLAIIAFKEGKFQNPFECEQAKEMEKQETLEEVSKREFPYADKAFIEGAKHQSERMYSEEEVSGIINKLAVDFNIPMAYRKNILEWFEQFKKK